ncbi:phage holin family protein [Flavobacterium macrobrachii]|uniref:phage holin family protein n=1 Tax=Flavobacterium macrobrachii TaxID=591204 RepID=UPI003F719D1C
MKLIIRLLVTAILVVILSYIIKGIQVEGFLTALTVAIVLGLLNLFVKPILVVLTLPVTIFTLGLFYLVINAAMILLCDHFVDGFKVDTFWTALIFSIVLSLSQSIVFKLTNND